MRFFFYQNLPLIYCCPHVALDRCRFKRWCVVWWGPKQWARPSPPSNAVLGSGGQVMNRCTLTRRSSLPSSLTTSACWRSCYCTKRGGKCSLSQSRKPMVRYYLQVRIIEYASLFWGANFWLLNTQRWPFFERLFCNHASCSFGTLAFVIIISLVFLQGWPLWGSQLNHTQNVIIRS